MPLQRHCAEICINLAGIPGLETPEILWMASFNCEGLKDEGERICLRGSRLISFIHA